jgi:hypothetical protein
MLTWDTARLIPCEEGCRGWLIPGQFDEITVPLEPEVRDTDGSLLTVKLKLPRHHVASAFVPHTPPAFRLFTAQEDATQAVHAAEVGNARWTLCGADMRRLHWDEVDGMNIVTCPLCLRNGAAA